MRRFRLLRTAGAAALTASALALIPALSAMGSSAPIFPEKVVHEARASLYVATRAAVKPLTSLYAAGRVYAFDSPSHNVQCLIARVNLAPDYATPSYTSTATCALQERSWPTRSAGDCARSRTAAITGVVEKITEMPDLSLVCGDDPAVPNQLGPHQSVGAAPELNRVLPSGKTLRAYDYSCTMSGRGIREKVTCHDLHTGSSTFSAARDDFVFNVISDNE